MTAPISNGPATTRLHHYAGHYWAACWESFIPVWPAGFRVGRVLSRRWSCVRYKVLPARLVGGLSGTKFSLQARNGLVSPFCGVWGEFCPGWVHRGRLLGEFYTGLARRVSCGESFVPGGSIGAACWESFIPVRPAGFRAGRVLSRKWSCVRYKVLPARLASAVGVKKFSLQARNGLVSPFCGVLGEFCPGWVHRGRLLGEFCTGSIRRGFVWGEFCPGCAFDVRSRGSFVPLIG